MELSGRRPGRRRRFPELPLWHFTVHEFTPSGYRVTAEREGGITGEATGSDPDSLLEEYRQWALGVDRDLRSRDAEL